MQMLSSLLFLVVGVTAAACFIAVAYLPVVAGISAVLGFPLVPDICRSPCY
jgi:hypothetical protein